MLVCLYQCFKLACTVVERSTCVLAVRLKLKATINEALYDCVDGVPPNSEEASNCTKFPRGLPLRHVTCERFFAKVVQNHPFLLHKAQAAMNAFYEAFPLLSNLLDSVFFKVID